MTHRACPHNKHLHAIWCVCWHFLLGFLFWLCNSGDPKGVESDLQGEMSMWKTQALGLWTGPSPHLSLEFLTCDPHRPGWMSPSVSLPPVPVLVERVSCCAGIGGLIGLHVQPGWSCPVYFCISGTQHSVWPLKVHKGHIFVVLNDGVN